MSGSLAGRFVERVAHQVAVAAGGGGGEAEELAQGQGLGGGQVAVELLGEVGDRAQAVALVAVEVGVEGVDGGVDGLEDAAVAGGDGDHRLLPGGDLGADGVFLDHGGQGLGDALGLAHEGGDGGEARLVEAVVVQRAEGGEAAEAGDQAVAVRAVGLGELEDLDRHAQAVGDDGEAELDEGVGVERRRGRG